LVETIDDYPKSVGICVIIQLVVGEVVGRYI